MAINRAQARPPAAPAAAPEIDRTSESIERHLEDAAHFPGGHAEGIARPRSEAEVAALLQAATHVLPIGAQSSLTGGATPAGGLVLSTERLRTVQELGRDRIRVGAGLSLQTLQELLSETGRWYAPFPTFLGASVGGVVATNAAGAATFKYGVTRAWVEGLTVVLACGCVLELARGDTRSTDGAGFELHCAHGARRFEPGRYTLPSVPKCSAGYFTAPELDLIDLFIGAEGTLGVIVDATLRVLPQKPALAFVLVPVPSERLGLTLVRDLREAARQTWTEGLGTGIDVAAIESVDKRCLEVLAEDGVSRRAQISLPPATSLALIVQLELPPDLTDAQAFDQIAATESEGGPDSSLGAFCDLLRRHGVFDDAEIVLPGNGARRDALLAFREGAPAGVNRRVGDAKRLVDDRIDKTAADMIVPFERCAEMLEIYRDAFDSRGLDHAIWGHLSDGNVHPNVIPRSYDDVVHGKAAILECGERIAGLGGCPLAEHGVGRNPVKQALLRQLYGERGIDEMRAVKRVLDPDAKLAPGVIFVNVKL